MILEKGKYYDVTIQVRIDDDIDEFKVDKIISDAVFHSVDAEVMDIGLYKEVP